MRPPHFWLGGLAVTVACSTGGTLVHQPEDHYGHDHLHDDHEEPEVEVSADCRSMEDPDGLLTWCSRLSPEELPESDLPGPRDGKGDDTAPKVAATALCGTFNLLGGVQVAGSGEAPVVLYCDYEIQGGMRAVHLSDDGLVRRQLADGCVPVPQAADVEPTEDGLLAAWATDEGVLSAELESDGRPRTEAELVLPMDMTLEVALAGGDLYAADVDARLWNGGALVSEAVVAWGAVDDWRAVCTESGWIRIDGPLTRAIEADCAPQERIGLAEVDGVLAVAVGAADEGRLVWLDPSGIVAEAATGRIPQVVPHPDGGWLSLDADGAFVHWTDPGEATAEVTHPLVAATEAVGLTLRADPEGAVVGVVSDQHLAFDDHYYAYNTLEVARSRLP